MRDLVRDRGGSGVCVSSFWVVFGDLFELGADDVWRGGQTMRPGARRLASCMPMRHGPLCSPAPRSCPKPTRLIYVNLSHYLCAAHQLVMGRQQQWVGQEMGRWGVVG